jgi:DNA-binding IclR family transcriptional regulator
MRREKSKSAAVGVVTKVFRILEALYDSTAALQLKDIAEKTAINKSTAYRFLAHLHHEGYVFRDSAGAYTIGVRLARLGSGASYQTTVRKISRPVLEELAHRTGETVSLAVLEGREVLYLDVMESAYTLRQVSHVGTRHPLYCTALGKAMLAFSPEEEQKYLISGMNFERLTPHTITCAANLRKELTLIRQRGYSLDDEEVYLGSRCIGAPILDASDQVVAALSVSGPTTRLTQDRVPSFAGAARQAAAEISTSLAASSIEFEARFRRQGAIRTSDAAVLDVASHHQRSSRHACIDSCASLVGLSLGASGSGDLP